MGRLRTRGGHWAACAWLMLAGSAGAGAQVNQATPQRPSPKEPRTEAPAPQVDAPGPQGQIVKRSYVSPIDGAELEYAVWLPPDYEQRQDWPLIVFLHGSGEGADWLAPTTPHASIPVRTTQSDLPFVVVFPLLRGSWSISALAERDVLDTLADVQAHLPIDAERVHLVGLSMGGFAAWRIACRYPDRFASLTVFCGGGEPDLAGNVRHLPIRLYHGAADPVVPVEHSRTMAAALQRLRVPVEYVEVPAGNHLVWPGPLAERGLYEWMSKRRRVCDPARVSFRTNSPRYSRSYWVAIEEFVDAREQAFVDAFVPEAEAMVLVHVENVARLRLSPPVRWFDSARAPLFVVDNRRVKAESDGQGWVLTLAETAADRPRKREGLSGPIQDVLLDPFVVVVASDADGKPLPKWQAAAEQAFAWRHRLTKQSIRFLPAAELTAELAAGAHLICFGDSTNHAVLAELTPKLPLYSDGQRVYVEGQALPAELPAMVMVYPNLTAPGRCVVICSGKPEAVARLAAAALAPPMLHPPPQEDLLLLDARGRVLAPGGAWEASNWKDAPLGTPLPPRGFLFTHTWELPPAVVEQLRALPNTDGP
ncbi:MAG TPA: alpha/beta hydrolase-fold protein [Phycisphaerae bacterium]|nr:alpha/beta hydrolase-fold protein [Phycisphaerae bacterium]HNU44892.1 alpha/beta hydrolase-fold protein [Phycisphaerae bacterium]